MSVKKRIGIIGAGPAGLTAAYFLAQAGLDVLVFEADPKYVGGISRTETYKDFYFDIGGHRFFSKSKEVEDFWEMILGDDLITRKRKSRIFYNGKFYSYPLKAFEALRNLGIWNSGLCVLSYFKARLLPIKNPANFEDWVSNQFGKKLFSIFFKTYTEKVWGMDCKEISADWASQRIKGLSLGAALKNALFPPKQKANGQIKTLIDSFRYPRRGPGMLWERCAEKIKSMGGQIFMHTSIAHLEQKDTWQLTSAQGESYQVDEIISSMPLQYLIKCLLPKGDTALMQAAENLRYRDFLTVILIVEDSNLFDDNWLYIHDENVKVGRIQNFKSWSEEMVPDEKYNCYGLEYFCFEHDGLWTMSDSDLLSLGKKEMTQIGLINPDKVVDGYVVRQPKAYPVYDDAYQKNVDTIRKGLEHYQGLQVVGRNGMHKYNNQDHSMMTAMLAAQNIINGTYQYDVWRVNEDAAYHESGEAGENSFEAGRMIPKKVHLSEKN